MSDYTRLTATMMVARDADVQEEMRRRFAVACAALTDNMQALLAPNDSMRSILAPETVPTDSEGAES